MKIQCELCERLVAVTEFRSSEAGIEVECPACGGLFSVRAAAEARRVRPSSPGTQVPCPKCGELADRDGDACIRCGLLVERFAGFEVLQDEPPSEALVELWNAARDHWQEPAVHERFLRAAVSLDAFTFAAGRYRDASRENPDDPIARARLVDVGRRAEAAILKSAAVARPRRDEGSEPYRNAVIVMALLLLVAAVAVVYALFIRQSSTGRLDEPTTIRTTPVFDRGAGRRGSDRPRRQMVRPAPPKRGAPAATPAVDNRTDKGH